MHTENVNVYFPAEILKSIYLLNVIVKTPNSKIRNVIIFPEALRILYSRRTKRVNKQNILNKVPILEFFTQ